MAPQRKTHCQRGHEFTEENTYLHQSANRSTPSRRCATCQKMAHNRWASKQPKKERRRNEYCANGHLYADHGYVKPSGVRRCQTCANITENKRYKGTLVGRARHLMVNFGMSIEDYDRMHAEQDGLCAICHKPEPRGLRVDHDHETKKVRALLCHKCNVGLGHFHDNPALLRAATDYIIVHQIKEEMVTI